MASVDSPHCWYALRVRSKGENVVASVLRSKTYETFLPTYQECRQYSDRIKKLNSPLFPGYLFCRLDPNRRLPVLETPGVEYILGGQKAPEPVPYREIEALQKLSESGANARPWPYLKAGHKVAIRFGAFAGVEGLVVQEKGIERLVLSVTLLQRSVAVELDRTWVRPVTGFSPAIAAMRATL